MSNYPLPCWREAASKWFTRLCREVSSLRKFRPPYTPDINENCGAMIPDNVMFLEYLAIDLPCPRIIMTSTSSTRWADVFFNRLLASRLAATAHSCRRLTRSDVTSVLSHDIRYENNPTPSSSRRRKYFANRRGDLRRMLFVSRHLVEDVSADDMDSNIRSRSGGVREATVLAVYRRLNGSWLLLLANEDHHTSREGDKDEADCRISER